MAELGVGEGGWEDDNQFLEMRNSKFGRFGKLSIGSELIHMVRFTSFEGFENTFLKIISITTN